MTISFILIWFNFSKRISKWICDCYVIFTDLNSDRLNCLKIFLIRSLYLTLIQIKRWVNFRTNDSSTYLFYFFIGVATSTTFLLLLFSHIIVAALLKKWTNSILLFGFNSSECKFSNKIQINSIHFYYFL